MLANCNMHGINGLYFDSSAAFQGFFLISFYLFLQIYVASNFISDLVGIHFCKLQDIQTNKNFVFEVRQVDLTNIATQK